MTKYNISALKNSMAEIQKQIDAVKQQNMDILISELRKNSALRDLLLDMDEKEIRAIAADFHNIIKRKRTKKKAIDEARSGDMERASSAS